MQKRQSRQREAQEKAQLRTMDAYQRKQKATEDAVKASVAKAQRGEEEEVSNPLSQPQQPPAGPVGIPGGASPEKKSNGVSPSNNLLRSSSKTRDKYVMKFNGWQPSQPDSGLPPSSGAADRAGSFGTPRAEPFLSKVMGNPTTMDSDGALLSPANRRASESVDLDKFPPRASRFSRDDSAGRDEEDKEVDEDALI